MTIEYTGRQTVVSAKQKTQADTALARVELVANRCTSAHVILTEDKHRKIAEVTVQCRGEQLVAISEATEMETALHDSLAKVEQQAIRHKERYTTERDHRRPVTAQ